MTEDQRRRIQLIELFRATETTAILTEGGDEVAAKLEGLTRACDQVIQRILAEQKK